MSSYYSDWLMAQMEHEERLRQAELDRMTRRVAKTQGRRTTMRALLQHVASLRIVFLGLRLHS